ncbi:MAG: 4-(cytidine 5'-diphospho)-2-C-methyl-D-erythritol kinase [Candidatus Dormibacteria bacterium]
MSLLVTAPAKLNLGLEVLSRRDDGLHELRTLMVNIDLADRVILDPGAPSHTSLKVLGPHATAGKDAVANLALRALRALESYAGHPLPTTITLNKRVPAGAGLGGGSADAAAVLRVAGKLGVEVPGAALGAMAFALGADVPFQLAGGAVLVGGAGEVLEPLRFHHLELAVCWPRVHCSTATVFALVKNTDLSDGSRVEEYARLWETADSEPPQPGDLPNGLWRAAVRTQPELLAVEAELRTRGWRPRLTGSGSAFYQVVGGREEAETLVAAARTRGYAAWACRTLPASDL